MVKYVLCAVSTHKAIAPYPYIWQHSASLYGHIRTSASCCSWYVAIGAPPALMISCKQPLRADKMGATKFLQLCIYLSLDLFLSIIVHIPFDVLNPFGHYLLISYMLLPDVGIWCNSLVCGNHT